MNPEAPIIALDGVGKEYAAAPAPLRVLRDVTMAVSAGERIAIVGPSGCGKSTLLNLMGMLDTPTAGRIVFDGKDVSGLSAAELAHLRNRAIGFVFQMHHLLPQCTVLENVLVPALVAEDIEEARGRALHLLESVGLGGRLDHRPGQLSGGECQRVAVVRALVNRPKLLLADEPTGSLNQEAAEQLADVLLQLNRQAGMALVLVTHSLSIAVRAETKIFELRDGTLTPGA